MPVSSGHMHHQWLPALALQVNHLLELGDRSQGKDKYEAIDKWAKQLNALHGTVINKLQA